MKKYKFVLMAFVASVGLIGCSEDDTTGNTEETATVRVELTDAPGEYQEVWVEVEDLLIKREATADEEEGWESLGEVQTGSVDLLSLTGGVTKLLAETEIPAGYLEQMRLVLGDNNYVLSDGVSYVLNTPSAQQSGLKMQVNQELEADIEYKFILDFDVDKSVVKAGESGNFNLHPVLRLSAEAETGSVVGTVHPSEERALVSAENGDVEVSAFTNEEGEFKLNGLPAGTYRITVTPDAETSDVVAVKNNVKVENGNVTDVDVIYLSQQ